MTTNNDDPDQIIAEAMEIASRRISFAADEARALLDRIERTRDEQPERLAKARADAAEARGWSLIEEPWDGFVSAVPSHDMATGQRTGGAIALPSITAKEMFGARLAFDMLDCGDDFDRIDEVQERYFSMVRGDTGLMFLLAMSALSTIASVVVPQMLDDLEEHASNYEARVMLAEARRKAWDGRADGIRSGTTEGTPE